MTDVVMPKLSDSMERGTIIRWLTEEGQPVAEGDELVEIETDKAAVAHVAPAGGFLHVLAPEGTVCDIGTPIAQLTPVAEVPVAEVPVDGALGTGASANGVPTARETASPALVSFGAGTDRSDVAGPAATPLARRVAATHGVTLGTVSGTGPRGRITQGDVLRAAGVDPIGRSAAGATIPRPAPAVSVQPGGVKGDVSLQPLTSAQRVIATRMAEANTVVPAFQLHKDVVLDHVLELRRQFKALSDGQPVPSLNDVVIKACAVALGNHPLANASFTDDGFELHGRVNVGFAVAVDGTLLVPTVVDADRKSLRTIAGETRDLSSRARAGSVTPAELSGGTFTVSNLGMYGMTAITPVINLPQAAIMGVGASRPVLVRMDGDIVDRTVVTLTLNCDHRVLYGADAASFLSEVQQLLEAPLSLFL